METIEILQELSKYESKIPTETKSETVQVLSDMYHVAKTQTDNFTNPNNISSSEVDVRPILKRENVEPDKWVQMKQSFKRSEKQSLMWLLEEVKKKFVKNTDAAKAKALALFKFRAAAKLKLKTAK